jgi:hypothetical protein
MRRWLLAVSLIIGVGCGDDGAAPADAPPADADTRDILVRLSELPGVTVQEMQPMFAPEGYRYFVLQVQQPVDHANPDGPSFTQEVSLIHKDTAAPMVALTTGYQDYVRDAADEPTEMLQANQISIEHRYFGTSRPTDPDWSKLTIKQMADDEHAIVVKLKAIYATPWISTGASKGGMTATYHRRFYPDDVVATIAYVAPLSFGLPDARYATFLAADGEPTCAAKVRDVSTEMLHNRRAALLSRAQTQATTQHLEYTRIAIGPALESAIRDIEYTYWQYYGEAFCGQVPDVTATDAQMWAFLDQVSPVSFSADDETAAFDAYFYQAYFQLGSPGTVAMRGDIDTGNVAQYAMYSEADYALTLPLATPAPTLDPAPMQDIDTWAKTDADRVLWVYGAWDPWSAGAYTPGTAHDTAVLAVAHGTHGANISRLASADRQLALQKIEAWTGVHPIAPSPRLRVDPRRAARITRP